MNRKKRLHNYLAESLLTLPVCMVLAVLLWGCHLLADIPSAWQEWVQRAGGLCAILLTTYVITETNNTYQLIRIRTRLTASVSILLMAAMGCMHAWGLPSAATLASVCCYSLIMRCYQQAESSGRFFHVTLLIALGSLWDPLLALFLVPAYFYMAVYMRAMSARTFWGGMIGASLPYLMWYFGCFLTDRPLPAPFAEVSEWLTNALWNDGSLTHEQLMVWGCLAFYSLIGIVHYWYANYNDKIRTRQMQYIYVGQTLLLHLCIAAHPASFDVLAPLLAIACTPLLTHYVALTRSWMALGVTLLSLAAYVTLLFAQRWMPF